VADLAALDDRDALWLLAATVLAHELGLPVPVGPVALVIGARVALAGTDLLPPVAAIVAATLIGNAVWFAAGRRYGAGVPRLLCRSSLTADTCVSRAAAAFGRWGWSVIVVGRFIPGISLVAPPLAGALGMGWGKFLLLTAAGAALYGVVVIGAGLLLHAEIEAALRLVDEFGWHTLSGIAGLLALYVAWRWWWRRRMARMLDVARIALDERQGLTRTGGAPVVPSAIAAAPAVTPGAPPRATSDGKRRNPDIAARRAGGNMEGSERTAGGPRCA
jgi:membrane protein DedA with SNARE-associated domain